MFISGVLNITAKTFVISAYTSTC